MDNTYEYNLFSSMASTYCSCFQMDNQIKSIWVTICSSFKILIFLLICVNDISESIIWDPRYKYLSETEAIFENVKQGHR